MLYSYKECIEKWHSDYQVKKQLAGMNLYRIESGLYSDTKEVSTLAILVKKYPDAVVTMDSAFYYHGLTDVIPDQYCFATAKHAAEIQDSRIHQFYIKTEIFMEGVTSMNISGRRYFHAQAGYRF